ncbi:Arm DNA-binding domain-containing protein [Enterococcus termitis]
MARKSNVYKDNNGWYFKASLGSDPITGKRRTKTKRGLRRNEKQRKHIWSLCFCGNFSKKI